MRKFTPEDLVQYLYSETSPQKSEAIKSALQSDFDLNEKFEQMVSGKERLEKLTLSPRNEAINKIMQYAGKSMTELHHH